MIIMEDWQWKLIRKAVYFSLLAMDNKLDLPQNASLPKNMDDLGSYVQGIQFVIDLNKTLKITSDALKDIATRMAEIHRVAAAVKVNAPSAEVVAQLKEDLQTISEDLKNDQRFKAGVALAGAVANIIGKVRDQSQNC